MLFDPKWEKKTDAITHPSLRGLITWLESKRPETAYCYTDAGDCLAARYLKAHGIAQFSLDSSKLDGVIPGLAAIAQDLTYYHERRAQDWTFGGALKRARAALASEP